jgi:hypothetical protein
MALAIAGVAFPDDNGTVRPAAGSSSGNFLKDISPSEYLPEWFQLGGQIRGRFEAPSGTSLANSNSQDYYFSRIRVDLTLKPLKWLKFFVQGQDARVGGYSTSPAPTTLYNPMDLRQGYIALGHEGRVGVQFRAGRQEMAFGTERLIGPADWNLSKTFDALDLGLSYGRAKVDLFAGSLVQIDSTRFDRHRPGEHFYGAYTVFRNVLPGMNIEPYVLFKQNLQIKSETGVPGDGLVVSPGVRLLGKTPGRLDYSVETVLQKGSYSSDRVSAFAESYVLGWTIIDTPLKPRLSAEYSYATGDAARKDGIRGTFDQFYPSNHSYYGMIDQFGWKNLKNWRAGYDCLLWKKTKFRLDFNEFYLATVQDSLYGSSGSAVISNPKATSNHIGSEINATAMYQWSKIWKFGAGWGRLFAGEYLKQSKADFGYTYPYVVFVGTF